MSVELPPLLWPEPRAGEALLALARARGWQGPTEGAVPPAPSGEGGPHGLLGLHLDDAGAHLGLEAEPWRLLHADPPRSLRAPCLLRPRGEAGLLAVHAVHRGRARLLVPDAGPAEVPAEALLEALRSGAEGEAAAPVERVLEAAAVAPGRRRRARQRLLAARVGDRWIARGWQLRPPPGAPWRLQAREAAVPRLVARLLALQAATVLAWLAQWWALWQALGQVELDPGWLAAWVLLLATLLPLRLAEPWLGGILALRLGWLLKRRLLAGALRLPADAVRARGSGRLLGTVLESEAAESLALDGGAVALAHAAELAAAVALVAWGSGGGLHLAALVAWAALLAAVAAGYLQARRRWTRSRIDLTDDLVETLAGHRTRLAQAAGAGQEAEDRRLAAHVARSRRPDRLGVLLAELPGPGWLGLSLLALAPAWLDGGASRGTVALGLGGMLVGFRAFTGLGRAAVALVDAAIAAREVELLWRAAARPTLPGDPEHGPPPAEPAPGDVVLDGRRLAFSYRPGQPVLQGCSPVLRHGDRVLLQGRSGSGKSTLASILLGLRSPEAGSLLLHDADRETLGEAAWRRSFASAPQFHRNHVFVGTLAFNLLLGRRWPPEEEDLALAETLCRELGLGELLDRMPAGLHQVVGEVGWQLSSGERSRVYVARALLQEAPVVVLDESFGALDPESLGRAMACVERRAPTLVVIGHS